METEGFRTKKLGIENSPWEKLGEVRKKIEEGPEIKPQLTFMFPLSKNRLNALEMIKTDRFDKDKIKKLLESNDFFEQDVGAYLKNLSEKTKEILPENIFRQEAGSPKIAAFGYPEILGTQKPLFATPHTEKLIQRVSELEKFTEKLKEKYKDEFIGLTVFGSTAKGYFREKSDIDCSIIFNTEDEKARQEFEECFWELAEGLKVCFDLQDNVSVKKDDKGNYFENYMFKEEFKNLFSGLFFGDKRELIKAQESFLKHTNKKDWDKIRELIKRQEVENLNLQRISSIFETGYEKEELEKIKHCATLSRVPPPYQETLKIIQKRARHLVIK